MKAVVIPFRNRRPTDNETQSKLQRECDQILEDRIQMAHELLLLAQTEAEQRRWFEEMKRLCAMRTPAQIKRMEAEKGLR